MVRHGIELPTEDARCHVVNMLTPAAALDACREQLLSVEPAVRAEWRCCRAIEALYRPGRYVRVAFALLTDDRIPTERCWREGTIVYLHWPVRRAASRRHTVLRIKGYDLEAYCFPNDRRLRSLRKFTRRASAAHLWQKWAERWGAPASVEPATLRRALVHYVPEQKLVARMQTRGYQASSDGFDLGNVALRFLSPEDCPTLARLHNAAAKWARERSKHLYIPEAAVVDAASGIVALEWVRGRSLLDKLRTGEPVRVMRRMASALHSFHRLPVDGLERIRPHDVYSTLEAVVSDLCVGCPALRSRLTLVAEELRRRLGEIHAVAPAALHDDLHWNQVRIRRRRYALLDLERVCTGDPLIDVANLAARLRMLGGRPEFQVGAVTATRWADELLAQWASTVGRPIASDRFRVYAAVSLLKLARGMMRHLHPGWCALAHRCVEEAEAELSLIQRSAAVP